MTTLAFAHGPALKDVSAFAAILDREEFRRELERLCTSRLRWGRPEQVRSHALSAHRHRCTFEIAVKTASGWRGLIAKVYADDRADVFQAMQALVRAGFGAPAEFSIPQPVAYLAGLGIRLEEKVEGQSAQEIFLNGSRVEQVAAAERSGRWLARFHEAAPPVGTMVDVGQTLARCERWTGHLVGSGGALARKAEELFTKLHTSAPAPAAVAYRAGHGSYTPDRVVLAARRTMTTDLDGWDVADPSRDLAWFIVSLQRRALKQLASRHALDEAIDAFLQAYTAEGRGDAIANLAFHRALECVHRARRDCASHDPLAHDWAAFMLDEGLRALI